MSLLLENHLIDLSSNEKECATDNPCWELLSCPKVLCPAHGRENAECWLIPRTHCGNFLGEDFFRKLASCLSCAYFKLKGEQYPRGWNHFLSDQMHKYNLKALERIYQKEESFVEILNRIPDGLFTTDQEWRITYFNPAAEKITGFSAYDAVGMYCRDVFKNSICESDCALKRAVAEGNDIHNREYTITNIDGKNVPIICSTSAFQDSSDRITGGIEIFKDISEIKRLQEEIVRRERKYRRVFEGSHDMIYTTNQQGDILDMNQAGIEMLGFPDKESLLASVAAADMYRVPEDREKFLEIINRTGFTKDYEVEFKRRNGVPLQVLLSSRRYENMETGDVEYEGIIKDITHRKHIEEVIRQRNRELSILNSVAVALNNSMDLDHILKVTLKNVLSALQIDCGGLFLINRDEKSVSLQARTGLPKEAGTREKDIVFKDEELKIDLIDRKVRLAPKSTFPSFQMRYRSADGENVPWLSCFLITFKGQGVGFFGLDIPNGRELDRHEVHLLGSLGNFLGGAIENARLMKTIRMHRQELRRLTEKLFQSQEEERRRIARELHDEAGQSLTAVKLSLDRLEEKHANGNAQIQTEIEAIRKMVRRTSSEIRRLSYHLHPTLLIDLGLEPALNLYFKETRLHSGLDIEFNMVGFDKRLDPDTETVFYRFTQETLNNVLKHSGAEKFWLSIIKSYPGIIFVAEDDGVGFDTNIVGKDKRSLGLLGMRERASLLGGTFQLRSSPGRGTRIRINIPFGEEDNHE